MYTLLEVCPATASNEQSIPSESHALITQHQSCTPISVTRRVSHCQTLQERTESLSKCSYNVVITRIRVYNNIITKVQQGAE